MSNNYVMVPRELLAGLVSNDRETRLDAERRMYGVLANQPAEADGVEVAGYRWKTAIPEAMGGGYGWSYASHWSTGPKDAEKLMTIADHLAALSAVTAEADGVERYDWTYDEMAESQDGNYVRHGDYDAVTAERDRLDMECGRLLEGKIQDAETIFVLEAERDQLRAEVEALRKAMEKAQGIAYCALDQIGGIRHGANVTSSDLWASCGYLDTLITEMRAAMAAKEA